MTVQCSKCRIENSSKRNYVGSYRHARKNGGSEATKLGEGGLAEVGMEGRIGDRTTHNGGYRG